MSPPARSAYWALKTTGVDFEYKHVELIKETRTKAYKSKVNSLGQVPALEVDSSTIAQSNTIVRYVSGAYDKKNVILPSQADTLARAKAEEIQDIATTSVTSALLGALFRIAVGPAFLGLEKPSEEEQGKLMDDAYANLDILEQKLGKKTYFTGSKLYVGDVEIYFLIQTLVDMLELDVMKYSNLSKWFKKVAKEKNVMAITEEFREALAKNK